MEKTKIESFIMKTIFYIITFILGSILLLSSCSDMDEYRDKYTDGDEIRYAGKPVGVAALSGYERIGIEYQLGPDVTLVKTVIYWSNRSDSVIVDLKDKLDSDIVQIIIENLPEGSYSFELVNYDYFGNHSVSEYVVGRSYGSRYNSILMPRPINDCTPINFQGDVQMVFSDPITNSVGVEISYISEGSEVTVYMENEARDNKIIINKCDIEMPILYRTMYKPDVASIDTFYTQWDEIYAPDQLFVQKPYANLVLTGDAPAENANSWLYLWNGAAQVTWKGYSAISYNNFRTVATNKPSEVWVTFDIKQPVKVARLRMDYYYYREGMAPKILDLMAYTGTGVPPSLAVDNADYWKDWIVIHTYDNSDPNEYPYDAGNASLTEIGFDKGLDASFEVTNVPKAQYYRLRCRAAWDANVGANFSLSEMTVWGFLKD